MSTAAGIPAGHLLDLVPRLEDEGYSNSGQAFLREWLCRQTSARLDLVGASSLPSQQVRGNIENPIGAAQVPLGVAGPLLVHTGCGSHTCYVPMATTEGALVRSYERGMVALTRAGGVHSRVVVDENRVCPIFTFADVCDAEQFVRRLPLWMGGIRAAAEATTRHGKLARVEPHALGMRVILNFCWSTGDAHGMNMIVKGTEAACEWLVREGAGKNYLLFSGGSSEKRASGSLLAGGKGKKVIAGARLPERIVRAYLHTTPEQMRELWHLTVLGHLQAGVTGYNGHYANGLAAIFIACGQDVANVANSAVGITDFDVRDGDLYASVTLSSLTVATVGGGTNLGTGAECLRLLDCSGAGKARKLAEIVAAALLAGELSMGAAIASREFVGAHERYGRNRPQ